jgi:hypothetical protein
MLLPPPKYLLLFQAMSNSGLGLPQADVQADVRLHKQAFHFPRTHMVGTSETANRGWRNTSVAS